MIIDKKQILLLAKKAGFVNIKGELLQGFDKELFSFASLIIKEYEKLKEKKHGNV